MMSGFLFIIGVYGLCAALVHTAYVLNIRKRPDRTVHLVLITRNNESIIEWYLYSYLFITWLRGHPTVITVFDEGSTDNTLRIINRFSREQDQVNCFRSTEFLNRFVEDHKQFPTLLLHLSRMDLNPMQALEMW